MIAGSFLPLMAMGTVFVAAGWLALRKSARTARFWAAAGLLVLAAANVLDIQQTAGPWWPLVERGWDAGDWLAVLIWLAALVLVVLARQRARDGALLLLLGGGALFVAALAAAAFGHSAYSATLCPGQSAAIGPWSVSLRKAEPVVGANYSGVRAELRLRSARGEVIAAAPEHRTTFAAAVSARAGAATVVRWNDQLLIEAMARPANPECMEIKLTSRSYGQWLGHAAWLLLLGAMAMSAGAMRSAWRRAGALERIAMRRADHGRAAMPAAQGRLNWPPVALALACGSITFLAQRPPPEPAPRTAIDGVAMIAARQARFGGPHLNNRWLVTGDALARYGQFGNAATMLLGAVESEPGNAEAWTALGDALVAQAGGSEVPAAQLAYSRAAKAEH